MSHWAGCGAYAMVEEGTHCGRERWREIDWKRKRERDKDGVKMAEGRASDVGQVSLFFTLSFAVEHTRNGKRTVGRTLLFFYVQLHGGSSCVQKAICPSLDVE